MNRPFSFWLCAMALMVVLLLAAVVFLAGQIRVRYQNQLEQQVWPARITRQPTISGSLQNRPVVLLFGDSRMAAWSGMTSSNFTIVNASQNGATTGQLRLLLPGLLDQFHPRTVVFEAGINDLKLAGLKPDLEGVLVAEALNNFSNMVVQCSTRGCRVILLETWPVGQPELLRMPLWNRTVALGVSHLNKDLRRFDAPLGNVRVVDILKNAGVAPEENIFRDALHFRPAVYERLTPALLEQLSLTSQNKALAK